MDCQNNLSNIVPADLTKVINKYELDIEESLRRMMDRHMPVITKPNLKELMCNYLYSTLYSKEVLPIIEKHGILRYQDQECNQYRNTPTNSFIYVYEMPSSVLYQDLYPKIRMHQWIAVRIEHYDNNNKKWWCMYHYSLQELFHWATWNFSKIALSLYSRLEHKRRELKENIDWPLESDVFYWLRRNSADHNLGQFFILEPFSKDHDLDTCHVWWLGDCTDPVLPLPPTNRVISFEYIMFKEKPHLCRIISKL